MTAVNSMMWGSFRAWRVSLPNRTPFLVIVAQGATATEMLAQWPGATLEVWGGA